MLSRTYLLLEVVGDRGKLVRPDIAPKREMVLPRPPELVTFRLGLGVLKDLAEEGPLGKPLGVSANTMLPLALLSIFPTSHAYVNPSSKVSKSLRSSTTTQPSQSQATKARLLIYHSYRGDSIDLGQTCNAPAAPCQR